MMNVRIAGLELRNFKNVRYGSFSMPEVLYGEECSSDILAIFGQNGSGKSAAIDAFAVLSRILSGQGLPGRTRDLVNVDSDKAEIKIRFCLEGDEKTLCVDYTLTIGGNGDARILSECLEAEDGSFRITRTEDGRTEMEGCSVPGAFSEKTEIMDASAFFIPERIPADSDDAALKSVRTLSAYARTAMIVIRGERIMGSVRGEIPLYYIRMKDGEKLRGRIELNLNRPMALTASDGENLKETISDINSVLGTVIPEMSIEIREGKDGVSLFSLKNGSPIPLRSESEGIIKLISLISILIFVYNERGSALIIDELDASIYEYLLGELMEVFRYGAAGQLILTSHNLRILEMIDRRSLIISTRNPDEKYMRLPDSVPDTENLRSYYLRNVLLSDDGKLSAQTDPHEIARALRKAWRRG